MKGLVISGFHPGINDNGNGIAVHSNNNTIVGNFIGTNAAGTVDLGNANAGVNVGLFGGGTTFTGNRIGGSAPADRNILSGGAIGVNLTFDSSGTQILGNLIGTNAAGTAAIPNTNSGIANAGTGTIIGAVGAGNVISGNDGWGINTTGDNTTIKGNFIGTNAAGTAAVPNGLSGVNFGSGATGGLVGGAAAGEGNVISGNSTHGIEIGSSFGDGVANNITVFGNWIGTSLGGGIAIGNTDNGIGIFGTSGAIIGGVNAGEANTIANNAVAGVAMSELSGTIARVRISGNSIHSNGTLGIDLEADDVTPNDAGDVDTGPNGLQNFPVLTTAAPNSVTGTLNSTASATFTIEFFTNTVASVSGFGEGLTYIGSKTVTTDASGNGTFTFTPSVAIPAGRLVTATATTGNGSTSEFSQARALSNNVFVWDGGAGADSSWFNPINWDLDSGVPGAADTAILNTAKTISLPSDVTVTNFTQNDGTFTGAAKLTVTGTFAFGKGTHGGTGSTVVSAGGTFAFNASMASGKANGTSVAEVYNNSSEITYHSSPLPTRSSIYISTKTA